MSKTDSDYGDEYDRIKSLRSFLADTSTRKSDIPKIKVFHFERGFELLSDQTYHILASGFIRLHCKIIHHQHIDINISIPLHLIVKYSALTSKAEFNPFIIQQRKICSNCFASNIKSFVDCHRCENAKYCNEKCQNENWKYHQKSCAPITDEIRYSVNALSATSCVHELKTEHKTGEFSNKTTLYLKRIKYLLETFQCYKNANDIGHELNMMPPKHLPWPYDAVSYYKTLYASPGFVEFIFNAPLIRKTRLCCYEKWGYPPNWDYLDCDQSGIIESLDSGGDVINDTEFEIKNNKFRRRIFFGSDAYQIALYVVNLLIKTLTHLKNKCDVANHSELMALIIGKLLEIYCNPHVVKDCDAYSNTDHGDATIPVTLPIRGLLPKLRSNEFNLGAEFTWDRLIMDTPFLDCVLNKIDHTYTKSATSDILAYVADNIDYDLIWKNERNGSYFLLLFSWMLNNTLMFSKDYKIYETRLCRKCINMALYGGATDKNEKKERLIKAVECVIRYQCDIRENDDMEVNVKREMFQIRPYFGFEFPSYDRAFWYFLNFYYLQLMDIILDCVDTEQQDTECIIEYAYECWEDDEKSEVSDIYKRCLKSSLCKQGYVKLIPFALHLKTERMKRTML